MITPNGNDNVIIHPEDNTNVIIHPDENTKTSDTTFLF
jgi:hypothetical protein